MNIQPSSLSYTAESDRATPEKKSVTHLSFGGRVQKAVNSAGDFLKNMTASKPGAGSMAKATENHPLSYWTGDTSKKSLVSPRSGPIGFSHLELSPEKVSLKSDLVTLFQPEDSDKEQKITLAQDKSLNPIAIFGFHSHMTPLVEFIRNEVNAIQPVILMVSLNKKLGLAEIELQPGNCASDAYFSAIKFINEALERQYLSADNYAPPLTKPFIKEWQDYLKSHQDKLDVFSCLSKATDSVGKEDRLKRLIVKNTDEKTDANRLFTFIRNNFFTCSSLDGVVEKLEGMKNDAHWEENAPLLSGVYAMAHRHFFRNTSKLGLAFFQEKGFDFIFAEGGISDEEALNAEEISLKKYYNHERRNLIYKGEQIQTWEPVSYSEVRFINKNLPLFKDSFIRVRCGSDKIKLARWGDEHWLEQPRQAFAQLKMSRARKRLPH